MRKELRSAARPPRFDFDIVALNIPGLTQALAQGIKNRRSGLGDSRMKKSDYRHPLRLLRSHRKRRCRGRAAKKRDELAPIHPEHEFALLGSMPPVPDPNDSTAVRGPLHCGISIRLTSAQGHLHALPRRSIAVRFTPVSGIESRSQGLPSRAKTCQGRPYRVFAK